MPVISLLTLVIGLLLGAVIGFLVARNREAAATADLVARASAADERARAAEQRTALVDGQLAERFQALSAQALDASARRFLEMAEGRFSAANARAAGELETRKAAVEGLVGPLKETLTRVEAQLRESDAQRAASHAALAEQMTITRRSSDELNRQTQALVTALRRPEARGRWGEMQLRRVVELAGMSARCDFDEQAVVITAEGQLRPDMVIHLAGGKNIVVDSKVSLAAYLEAAEATDDTMRDTRLAAHARHLRDHVDRLAAKAYWAALPAAPEFVVLFIPGEAFLAPALEHDPGLLEYAMGRRVHIATPTTLVSLLRTAQYAWQQEALSENARAVFEAGRELYERISGLGQHVDRMGKALTGAVTAYNQTVGSLESRVLVSARRLAELGLVEDSQEAPRIVTETTRLLAAPELTAVVVPAPAPALTEQAAPEGAPALPAQAAPEGAPAPPAQAAPEGAPAPPAQPAPEGAPALPAQPAPEGAPARAAESPGATAPGDATERADPAVPEATPEPTPATGIGIADSPVELFMAHTNGAAS
jgi:DNA recombination protein RmuC